MSASTSAAPPVLDYRPSPTRAGVWARRWRITMLIVAIAAVHLAAILILHPTIEASEYQMFLGGGAIGTPFSPTLPTEATGADRELSHNDEHLLRQYLPRAIGYLALF